MCNHIDKKYVQSNLYLTHSIGLSITQIFVNDNMAANCDDYFHLTIIKVKAQAMRSAIKLCNNPDCDASVCINSLRATMWTQVARALLCV